MNDIRDCASTTLMGCLKNDQIITVSDQVLSGGESHV